MGESLFILGTKSAGSDGLSDLDQRIGRKSAALQRLKLAGFPVPDGVCLPTSSFKAALAPFTERIQGIIRRADLGDFSTAQSMAGEIAILLEGLTVPRDVLQDLAEALPKLHSGLLAVRSSAEFEDLPESSFAGQYQSVLGVSGEVQLAQAILTCWRSFYSANALAARAGLEKAIDEGGMAVLIQPLVEAECAGVCFSVDPVRMDSDLALVSAGWGLGEGVTDGTVAADTIRLRRIDLGVEEQIIVDKQECIRAVEQGGLERAAVSESLRRTACLPENWLQRVVQFSLAAEQELGFPQDVEWAIAGGQVWILQSRPITTLPEEVLEATRFPIEWANDEEGRHFWWLERFNHHPGALLLPGEIDFITYRTLGGEAAVEYGGSAKTRWRKAINGHIYITVADSTLSPGEVRIRGAAMADLVERLQEEDITIWEHWGPEIIRATRRLAAFDARNASGMELADHLDDALAASQRHWMVHTLVPRGGRLNKVLEAYQRLTGRSRADGEEEMPFLLQGPATVQARLVDGLFDLAILALETPGAAEYVALASEEGWSRLRDLPQAEPFLAAFDRFLAEYGERLCYLRWGGSLHELPLPWCEAPAHVLEMVARYLPMAVGNRPTPRDIRERAYQNAQARVEALCAQGGEAAGEEFRRRLTYARRNALFTDDHNHYIDQLAEGQVAHALIYAARWLERRGDLTAPGDIYWLHLEEIMRALRSNEKQDFTDFIGGRLAQFETWEKLHPPATIGVPEAYLPERAGSPPIQPGMEAARAQQEGNRLTGLAVSRGWRSGRARVVSQFAGLPDIEPGDVLVAWHAGPEWTPVFAILGGLVLDTSYIGDHAAITAREFGVPAVFACLDATKRIPEGARVTVDGDRGVVEWE